MVAKAINQNDIVDIIRFYNDTMKAVDKQKINPKATQKSLHVYNSISGQIIEFYKISNTISQNIIESSIRFKKSAFDAQKSMIESINAIITGVNSFNGMKLPNMIDVRIRMWKLRKEVRQLTNMFLGPGGIAQSLNVFSHYKQGITTEMYDDKTGKLLKKTNIPGLSPVDAVKGFSDLVDTIIKIVNKSNELSKHIAKAYILLNITWPYLIGGTNGFLFIKGQPGIIDRYVSLIKSDQFKVLQDSDVKSQITTVSNNIGQINGIVEGINNTFSIRSIIGLITYNKVILPGIKTAFDNIIILYKGIKDSNIDPTKVEPFETIIEGLGNIVTSITAIKKFKINSKRVNKTISEIDSVVVSISSFAQHTKNTKFVGIKPQITTIKNIIDSMLSIVKDICLLALASVPMSLAVGPATITFLLINGFIWVVSKTLVGLTAKKRIAIIAIAMVDMTMIIGLMLLNVVMVLGSLILIANVLSVLRESAIESIAAFAVIGLVVTAIAGLAWLINKIFSAGVGRQVYEGLLLMIALIGVMLTATGMILLLAYAGMVFFTNNVWLYTTGMFLVTGAVVLAIAGLGYLIALWLPGIASFTAGIVLVMVSITAMLLVGLELNALAQFEFDEEKRKAIKSSTIAIIGAAHDVMDAVFNGTNEDDINRYEGGAFGRFFRSIFKGAAFMIEALTASFTLVMTTISVTMMLLIAYELETLTKFNIDRGAVLGSVNSIMGTANSVIDAIFQPAEDKNTPGGSGFLGAIGHFFTGIVDILELIVSIGKVALTMTAIGMVMLLAFELKGIAKMQFNSGEIINNVNQIMGAADTCIRAIFAPSTEPNTTNTGKESKWSKFVGFIKTTLGNVGGFIESVLGIGKLAPMMVAMGMISFLANTIKSINDIAKDVDKKTVLDNTDLVLGITDEIIKKVFSKDSEYDIDAKKLKSFNALTDSLNEFIKVFNVDITKVEKGTSEMIGFVDKINTADVTKLQTTTNLFAKMAEFSASINGNFEGLAEVLNERIMPLLEELKNVLSGTTEASNNMVGTISNTNAQASTNESVVPTGTQQAGGNSKDYTSVLETLKNEISNIEDILTNGTMITRMNPY